MNASQLKDKIKKETDINFIPLYQDAAEIRNSRIGSLGSIWQDYHKVSARWVPGRSVSPLTTEEIMNVGKALKIVNDWITEENKKGKQYPFK